jgi:uncharacterized surface protein with fasciclin (FAS1) repeats
VYFIENKTIIDNIRQTLSDVIAGLYPSWQVKDGAINQEFSVVNDYREITPQEVREAVKAIIAKCGTVTLENVREYANKVLEEEEAEFVIAQNAKGEAKQDISLSAYVNFNDESTWEKALEDHFIDNDIRLKEVSKLGYFNISPGNSLSQLIKEKTKDDNEQITLNLPEIRNVVVKGLDWYKQNFKSHYAEYIEPIRLQLISNEFLLKLLKAAREKEEKERKQAEEKKRIEEERKQAEEKKRIEEERKEKKRKEEEELAFVRIEDGEAEAKQDITLSAYVNFNDKSTWEKALEDHFIDNDIRLKEVSKLGYFSTSPGKLLFDLIKGKAKGGGTITLNLSEMRNVVVKGLDWYKQNFKSHYAKYIEPIRQELISNEFLLKLLNIASEKAEKKKN